MIPATWGFRAQIASPVPIANRAATCARHHGQPNSGAIDLSGIINLVQFSILTVAHEPLSKANQNKPPINGTRSIFSHSTAAEANYRNRQVG
jgi:hypothetical protein